jgi:hypothetical protein
MSSDVTAQKSAAMRPLAIQLLAKRAAGKPDAKALAAAARTAYDDLARVSVPLIGKAGVDALAGRACHLAAREHPCLVEPPTSVPPSDPFARVVACLERQDPAVAANAAAAVFAMLAGLLVTFIGEPLTMQLLRQAWPDALSDASSRSDDR